MAAMAAVLERTEKVTIRRASDDDRSAIYDLIHTFARAGEMLPVPLDGISIERFWVATVDGAVAGCGALWFWEDGTIEIRSLAVAADLAGRGIGKMLVRQLALESRAALPPGATPQLFALTLKPAFFFKVGFDVVPRGRFTAKERGDCASCPFFGHCREIAVLWNGQDPAAATARNF